MEGVTLVRIGGVEIGLLDLDDIFERVKKQNIDNEQRLMSAILQQVKESNYVPPGEEDVYADGLMKAYRRYLGEKVEEEITGLEIKILGPGCARCDKLEKDVRSLLTEMDVPAEVQHIRDPGAIADYGIFGTPALVMNRVVKSAGRVPRREEIVKWIEEFQDR